MTAVKVVDASALGSILFGEPSMDTVAARLRDAVLVAPNLLGYEIANICLKKMRENSAKRVEILLQFGKLEKIGIELVEIDFSGLPQFAAEFGLTSYDASYLWLAWQLDAELVTLDRRLARAASALPPPGD